MNESLLYSLRKLFYIRVGYVVLYTGFQPFLNGGPFEIFDICVDPQSITVLKHHVPTYNSIF